MLSYESSIGMLKVYRQTIIYISKVIVGYVKQNIIIFKDFAFCYCLLGSKHVKCKYEVLIG